MADKNERLSQNISGPYYVDSTCIDCDMCRGNAPNYFKRDDDTGYSVVYRQPATPDVTGHFKTSHEGSNQNQPL
jgi:ferredoxin